MSHFIRGGRGEGESGRQEFAGWGCQKNLKDGQNRGDGGGMGMGMGMGMGGILGAGRGTVSIL
ncbi:hypothetical protein [Xylella fastidiosa]|uniref:hypothetical protein n=1 Tax=Xylella fastidiosa TaxID=2371 RepID=UPI0023611840|nr:hypothetical protein [Xylella fastidiosa]MDD0868335.1 hypothetical protein [Xylella fastidiosa subsp. multiplex]MDD0918866.1 hypothetical protein [Xylella fastidiosa subsp. multiplex]MDD0938924.1 hypothetical protein [Xylella fastidiosa subsp. multiplex]MDD0952569.1 hypothetical protein [Xylella fastidiosa subsp. multiplex]MDD0959249.1 hypothetical protein [Xylella fastidiosa subsp. multiplex]